VKIVKKRRRRKSVFSKLTSKGVILTIQLITSIVFLTYIFIAACSLEPFQMLSPSIPYSFVRGEKE